MEPQAKPFMSSSETSVISSLKIPKIPGQSSSTATSLTPQEIENLQTDREKVKKQLDTLRSMLERVSKTVGTIARQNDGREWQDQTYVDNVKLKGDVEKRIQALRNQLIELDKKLVLAQNKDVDFWEVGNEPSTTSPTSTSMIEDKDIDTKETSLGPFYEYYDPGSHWCSQCNEIIAEISTYLKHMHSTKHWQHIDPNDQIWTSKKFCKPKPKPSPDQQSTIVQLKGAQFLVPIKGFYCTLCEAFMANGPHADDHLKTKEHNQAYIRHTLLNPNYEQKYSGDRAKAINRILNEKKKKKEQDDEEERKKELAKKRAAELDARRKERALREKIEQENRMKRARESADKEREREIREEKRKANRTEGKERKRIENSDDSSNDVKPHIFKKFKDNENTGDKTQTRTPVIVDKNDKKLRLKTQVAISHQEYLLCYNKYIKMLGKGYNLDLTQKSSGKKQEKESESTKQKTTIQKVTPSLPSFKIDSDDDEKNNQCPDLDKSIGDIVSSLSSKISASKEDNEKTETKTFGNFTIEADDDEVDDDFDSQTNLNTLSAFTTACPSISNTVSEVLPSQILCGDDLDDDLSESSRTLAFGSKDPNLNCVDSSPKKPVKSSNDTPKDTDKSKSVMPSDYLGTSNSNYNDSEKDVVDHLLAIDNECGKVKPKIDDTDEGKVDSFPTLDLNDLTKSPPYNNFTGIDDFF